MVSIQRDSHEQIANRSQRRVAGCDFQPRNVVGSFDDIDEAYISEIAHSHPSYRLERVLILQAGTQQSSELGQESLINFEALSIGDIKLCSNHSDGLIILIPCKHFSPRHHPYPSAGFRPGAIFTFVFRSDSLDVMV